MLYRCKRAKKETMSIFLLRGLARGVENLLILGGIAGGLLKLQASINSNKTRKRNWIWRKAKKRDWKWRLGLAR